MCSNIHLTNLKIYKFFSQIPEDLMLWDEKKDHAVKLTAQPKAIFDGKFLYHYTDFEMLCTAKHWLARGYTIITTAVAKKINKDGLPLYSVNQTVKIRANNTQEYPSIVQKYSVVKKKYDDDDYNYTL